MKNNGRIFNYICGVIIVLFLIYTSWLYYRLYQVISTEPQTETRIDTIEKRDTISYIQPKYIKSTKINTVRDTIKTIDSVEVITDIPIEQKIYKDSDYTAYISGYKSNLDSISIYPKTTTITKTITNTVDKTKKWGFTVGTGLQYDAIHNKPSFGFGIMWGYRF